MRDSHPGPWLPSIRSQVETELSKQLPRGTSLRETPVGAMLGLLPPYETRELSLNECIAEYDAWRRGVSALRASNNNYVKFVSEMPDGQLKFRYCREQLDSAFKFSYKTIETKTVTRDEMLRLFVSGEVILEDGPRDNGGFGEIVTERTLMHMRIVVHTCTAFAAYIEKPKTEAA